MTLAIGQMQMPFHLSYCELTIALFPHTCTFDNITLHADNAGDMYQVA